MTNERAIEILDPEHREHYESLAPVNEACRMGIEALKKQIPKKVTDIHCDEYYCPACGAENNCDQHVIYDEYCPNCGQKLDKGEEL